MTLSEAFLQNPEFKDKLEDLIINGDPETMTARSLRTQLEKHFKFEIDSLKAKPYKAITNAMIDEQLQKLSTGGFPKKDTKDSQVVKEEEQVTTKKKGLKNKQANSKEEDEKMDYTNEVSEEEDDKNKVSEEEDDKNKVSEEEDDKNEVSEEEEEVVKKPKKRGLKKRIVESEDEEMDEKPSLKNKVSDSIDDSDHKSDEEEEEIPKRKATKKRVISHSSEDEETTHSQKKVKKSKKVDSKSKGKARVVIEQYGESESESEEPKSVQRAPSKSKASNRPEGTKKDEDKIKRLRGYLSKCGIAFISIARKVLECQSAKEEIELLEKVLYDAGLRGTPSAEKCAAIKHKRVIQKEIEGLDTSLIIDSDRRATRTRQRNTKPTYTVAAESSEEEEDEEEDEEEEESESEDGYSQDEDEPTKKTKDSEEEDDD